MGGDLTYVKSVQEVVELLICKRELGPDDGFDALWWIHHQAAHEVARISLKLCSIPDDVPSLIRRYYGPMTRIVMKEMVTKSMDCPAARKAVSARMLRKALAIRDPVKVQSCRGAALLLVDVGDHWVAKEASELKGANIGGLKVWEARLRKVKRSVNAACANRDRPQDIPVLFGNAFSKLVSDASSRSVKETLPWSTAKKNVIERTFARNFPSDPVHAAAYTSAALLLGVVPDDSSPADQLRYATLYTSCLDGSRPDSRTVASPTVEGLKMAAAAAGSTPEQIEGMVPIQVGGIQTPATDKTPFKPPDKAEAFPAMEGDLGPLTVLTKNTRWPIALAENYKSTLPTPEAGDARSKSQHKSTPTTSEAGDAGSKLRHKSTPAVPEAGDARSKSQHSGWMEAISSTPRETLLPPLFGEESAAEVYTGTDSSAHPPLADVRHPSLGAGQSYGRSESIEDFGIALSENTAKHVINEFYPAATASATPTPPTVQVAGAAQTAGGPVEAQKAPRACPQGRPVSSCGNGATTNPTQTAPAVSETAGAGLGAAMSPPPALYGSGENTEPFGFDMTLPNSSVPRKTNRESPSSTEVGAVAAAILKSVGPQSMPVSVIKPSGPIVPGTTSAGLGTASTRPCLYGPRPSMGPVEISTSFFDNSLQFQTTGKPATKPEAGVVAGAGLMSVGAAKNVTAAGAGKMPPPTPRRPFRGVGYQSHRPERVATLACGSIGRVNLPLEAPATMRPSPAEAAAASAAAVAAAVAAASAEAALGAGRMAAQAQYEEPVQAQAFGVGVGTAPAPAPTKDASGPGTPAISAGVVPGLSGPGQNRAFDPQAPPLDSAQAAVGVSGRKQPAAAGASGEAVAYSDWFAQATAAGFGAGAFRPATRPPYGETRRGTPAFGAPSTAGIGGSKYSGGGGGSSPNKRKAGSSDGDDSAGGPNKKACNVSTAGDGTVPTYSGGSGSGSCNKRKGGSGDGYDHPERPTKKVCCV